MFCLKSDKKQASINRKNDDLFNVMDSRTGGKDDIFCFQKPFIDPRDLACSRGFSSSFFGSRGPFDDPFFADSFVPFPLSSTTGPSIFDNRKIGPPENSFANRNTFEFLNEQPLRQHRRSVPIVIEELSSDTGNAAEISKERNGDPEKVHISGKELYVPNQTEKVREQQFHQNALHGGSVGEESQTRRCTFHSTTTRCGGINGTYYTSSTTMKMGGDGVVVEERKEADLSSGRATHRVSRGILNKGHSLTRSLNPDGRINNFQTLHNLNEDELPRFEAAWKRNAGETLMGWNPGTAMPGYESTNGYNSNRTRRSSKVIDIEVLSPTAEKVEISKRT